MNDSTLEQWSRKVVALLGTQMFFLLTIIGHVNEYPTMHYLGIPRHTQSMSPYKILTEYLRKYQ